MVRIPSLFIFFFGRVPPSRGEERKCRRPPSVLLKALEQQVTLTHMHLDSVLRRVARSQPTWTHHALHCSPVPTGEDGFGWQLVISVPGFLKDKNHWGHFTANQALALRKLTPGPELVPRNL